MSSARLDPAEEEAWQQSVAPRGRPGTAGTGRFRLDDVPAQRAQRDVHSRPDLGRARDLLRRAGTVLAGMWEFRNRNVFGATAFSTYGAFWMAFGIFIILARDNKSFGAAFAGATLANAAAWFIFAFAIFNTVHVDRRARGSTWPCSWSSWRSRQPRSMLVIGNFGGSRRTLTRGCTWAAGSASSPQQSRGMRRRRACMNGVPGGVFPVGRPARIKAPPAAYEEESAQ